MWQTGHTMPPVRCDGGCDEQGVVSEGRMRDKPILAEKLKILGKLAELGGEDPLIDQTITPSSLTMPPIGTGRTWKRLWQSCTPSKSGSG